VDAVKIRHLFIAIIGFIVGFALGNAVLSHAGFAFFDTTWIFNKAVIRLDDFVVDGAVDSWRDYKDSDVVQVVIDGVTYLTSYENVVLINDPKLDD
jgi:hypothetical protein